jgi:hypothetical protein
LPLFDAEILGNQLSAHLFIIKQGKSDAAAFKDPARSMETLPQKMAAKVPVEIIGGCH